MLVLGFTACVYTQDCGTYRIANLAVNAVGLQRNGWHMR
jgi:hypothetical protein